MKNLYESILDDEEIWMGDLRKDTKFGGFENAIHTLTREISERFKQASKDKKLKELRFPDDDDIYEAIIDLFKGAINRGKLPSSNFKGYYFNLKIYYTGKKDVYTLNDERPKNGNVTLPAEESRIINDYFGYPELKIKCDTGIILLGPSCSGFWYEGEDKPYLMLGVDLNYKGKKNAALNNIMPLDAFGHEIHEGDWCAGTTKTISQIIYGKAKFTKARDKMYIDKCTVEFKNCIVIKHDGKPVDMSDVKDKSIELKY
jgi:hypothetical protein